MGEGKVKGSASARTSAEQRRMERLTNPKVDERWREELHALKVIIDALTPLDHAARERVLVYVCARFGVQTEGKTPHVYFP